MSASSIRSGESEIAIAGGADAPRVEVTEHGPYRVHGAVALVRTAQVETEYGEPVD